MELKHYEPASTSLGSGGARAAADVAERNLDVIGATAIEDRLQEGVPETIATLAAAKSGCGCSRGTSARRP